MNITIMSGDSKFARGNWGTYKPYPNSSSDFLQKKLPAIDVRQMGEGGTCMSRIPFTSIWNYQNNGQKSTVFKRATEIQDYKTEFKLQFRGEHEFEDAVWTIVSNFGTNDCRNYNWDNVKNTFVDDYKRYLDEWKGKHYICLTQPVFVGGFQIDELNDKIRQVANVTGTEIIDLSKGFTSDMFIDGVHPNAKGNELTAQIIYNKLKGAPIQPPIVPPTNKMLEIRKHSEAITELTK